jgi:hypothetical protein
MRGDPRKMVAVMIEAAESADPPRRLLLGSDAYALVTQALPKRRADFGANRAVSASTDRDEPGQQRGPGPGPTWVSRRDRPEHAADQ